MANQEQSPVSAEVDCSVPMHSIPVTTLPKENKSQPPDKNHHDPPTKLQPNYTEQTKDALPSNRVSPNENEKAPLSQSRFTIQKADQPTSSISDTPHVIHAPTLIAANKPSFLSKNCDEDMQENRYNYVGSSETSPTKPIPKLPAEFASQQVQELPPQQFPSQNVIQPITKAASQEHPTLEKASLILMREPSSETSQATLIKPTLLPAFSQRNFKSSQPSVIPNSTALIKIDFSNHDQMNNNDDEEEEIIRPATIGLTIAQEKENKNSDTQGQPANLRNGQMKQISFMEVWARMKTMDLSKEKRMLWTIRKSIELQSNSSIFNRLFGRCAVVTVPVVGRSSGLGQGFAQDKEQILALSQVPFDTSDSLHLSIIYSVYCVLQPSDFCPVNGLHWTSIGFKHANIKYNFADAGIFGAVQMLAFSFCYREYMCDVLAEIEVLGQRNKEASEEQKAKKRNKEINFSALLQQISRYCLLWLEKGVLDELINAEKSVISVINKVYFTTFYIFYEEFKKINTGFLAVSMAFKQAITVVCANPSGALDHFKRQISFYYKNRE